MKLNLSNTYSHANNLKLKTVEYNFIELTINLKKQKNESLCIKHKLIFKDLSLLYVYEHFDLVFTTTKVLGIKYD